MNFFEYLAGLDGDALIMGACLGAGATVLLTLVYVGLGALNDRRKLRKAEKQAEQYGRHSATRKGSSASVHSRTDTRSIRSQGPTA